MRLAAALVLTLLSCAAVAADSATTRTIDAQGAHVSVDFQSTDFEHGVEPIVTWIERSMAIVARYYGRFPAKELRIRVMSGAGSGVRHGTTYGMRVPYIRLQIGRDITADGAARRLGPRARNGASRVAGSRRRSPLAD